MSELPDYDRWLARYRHHRTTAYCQDHDCPNADGLPVEYHEEYGQGWIEPEECPDCGEALGTEPPDEPPEEDDWIYPQLKNGWTTASPKEGA